MDYSATAPPSLDIVEIRFLKYNFLKTLICKNTFKLSGLLVPYLFKQDELIKLN